MRPALVTTTFSNSRGGRLRELRLYIVDRCDISKAPSTRILIFRNRILIFVSTRIRCGCFRFGFNHPHEYVTTIYILLTTSKWACANRARDLISLHCQKWLIVVVQFAVLISMHATRLEISASKVEKRRLLSATLNLQVLF